MAKLSELDALCNDVTTIRSKAKDMAIVAVGRKSTVERGYKRKNLFEPSWRTKIKFWQSE